MKKLLFFGMIVFCIVDIEKIKAQGISRQGNPAFVQRYKNADQPQSTKARILTVLSGYKVPQSLINTVETATGNSIQADQGTVVAGSSNSLFKPVVTKYESGAAVSFDLAQQKPPKIVIDYSDNSPSRTILKAEITPRLDLKKTVDFEQGYSITNIDNGNITVEHFDFEGTKIAPKKPSSVMQKLQDVQKTATDFFRATKTTVQKMLTMPEGRAKDVAERNLAEQAVDEATAGQTIQPLEKQQLVQKTYEKLKKLLSTRTFNTTTFYAWAAYPFDRMTELASAMLGNRKTIVRDVQYGDVIIRTQSKNSNQITQETYKYKNSYDFSLKLVKQDIYENNVLKQSKKATDSGIELTEFSYQNNKKVETILKYNRLDMNSVKGFEDVNLFETIENSYAANDEFGEFIEKQTVTKYKRLEKGILNKIEIFYERPFVITKKIELDYESGGPLTKTRTYYKGYQSKPMMDEQQDSTGKLERVEVYAKEDASLSFVISTPASQNPKQNQNSTVLNYNLKKFNLGLMRTININELVDNLLQATNKENIAKTVDEIIKIVNGSTLNIPNYSILKQGIVDEVYNVKAKQLAFNSLKKPSDMRAVDKINLSFKFKISADLMKIVAENL